MVLDWHHNDEGKPEMASTKKSKPEPTAEQRAEWAAQREADVKAATQQITALVEGITSGEEWKRYLAFGARFHHYSFNNMLWLWAQAQQREMSPSRFAGFSTWKDMGHPVKKGEKAFSVLAPVLVAMKPEDKGYEPGKKKVIGFRLVRRTFDISQAERSEEIASASAPQYDVSSTSGEVPPQMWLAIEKASRDNGYPMVWGTPSGGAEGMTVPGAIVLSERFKFNPHGALVAFHEMAHSLLHMEADYDYAAHRGVAETEAEAVAFVVASAYGIDASGSSAGYIAGWSKDDPKAIITAGTRIMRTAHKIIEAIDAEMNGEQAE